MLRGDAGDHAGVAEIGSPAGFERFHLVRQLAQAFFDQLRFAAGAGGAEQQSAPVQIQLRPFERLGQQLREFGVAILIR